MITNNNNNTPVQEFYAGESVFITGSTGFIGKVLLEKLLRSCRDINKVYVLVRSMDRFDYLTKSRIFDQIRSQDSEVLSKVIPVLGNLTSIGLDISEDHLDAMRQEVSVFFHCAASVRFDEPPKEALETNLLGTKRVLDMFRKMKKRKAFVYLSTAYANSHLPEVNEEIYPTNISGEAALHALQNLPVDELNALAERIIEGRVNNYTLSKALTENYLKEVAGQLPVTIIRPSVVTCSWKEPYEGWVDSANAYTGVLSKIRLGSIRVLREGKGSVADLIPVDTVVNLMIVAPWNTHRNVSKNSEKTDIPVYHCTSSDINPILWTRGHELGVQNMLKYPSKHAVRVPRIFVTNNSLWHFLGNIYYHFLPALSRDGLLLLEGKKLKFVNAYQRYMPLLRLLEEFVRRSWMYRTPNTRKLYKNLSDDDQNIFNFNISELNWEEYMETYIRGIGKYVYPEQDQDLKIGQEKLLRLRVEEVTFAILLMIGMCSMCSLIFRFC